MKIKIAHIYYDLLNLYGEQGNIKAIENALHNQNIDYHVDYLSINDNIKFSSYDFIYLGMGSQENLLIVLEDIIKYKDAIKKSINKGVIFLATGNSHELFGQSLEINNTIYPGLEIFSYFSRQSPTKIVGESFMKFDELTPIIGFQNRFSIMQIKENHLFDVLKGDADNFKSDNEGYHENNFFGTYLVGPILIRNPHFNDYLINLLLKQKKVEYKSYNKNYEYQAYNEYIKNFYE